MKLRGAAAVAARLLAHKDAAYLARRLTGIVCDIPLEATLDDLKRGRRTAPRSIVFSIRTVSAYLRQQARRIAAGA